MIPNNSYKSGPLSGEYATKELYFAAFLLTKEVRLKKLEKYGHSNTAQRNSTPTYFIFEDKERCEQLENMFWSGIGDDIMVNIKEYITTLRDLKTRAFSVSRVINNYKETTE